MKLLRALFACGLCAALVAPASAGEWTHWRGPQHNGVADDTGLPATWSKDGSNLIWRADFTGRSTPVVFDGRVCATGRHGEGIDRLEVAACWNAETGEKVWERRWPVYLTAVPWTRVSWGDPAADSETGFLYVQAVNGQIFAFDREGKTAWEWEAGQDLGRFSGYGGRTNSPIVDEDRVIFHLVSSAWGPNRPAGDRYVAFDKRTGEIQWMTPRNGPPAADLNTYSTPVVAEIGGQRLMIAGGADGWVRAINARSGAEVWKFRLSQRGVNVSPVVGGDLVYIAHSEENMDNAVMGRLVAIDGTGSGDVTATHEKWRADGLQAGYASPTLAEGILMVPDNSANLVAHDAKTGEQLWQHNYGTVGKGSPVWADGKLYITEVNGNVVVVEPGREGAQRLDEDHITMPSGRYAEIYGSAAVGYGRIFFTTEEGIYAIGDKNKSFEAKADPPAKSDAMAPEGATATLLRVVPGVAVARASGGPLSFRVQPFDAKGRRLSETHTAQWSVAGLPGTIDDQGVLHIDADKVKGTQVGTVTAKIGELEGVAHLRVAGDLPWSEDFEGYEVGGSPAAWLGTGKGATVQVIDGNKVLTQPKAARGAPRATILMGPAFLAGYTVRADIRGGAVGRRKTDLGVVNSGYTFELQGNHQRIQISSWTSERRMAQMLPFEWEMDTWYTLEMRVDYEGEGDAAKAIIRGKAWRTGEPEPADWTMTVEDPHPIRNGAPGLYTYAPTEASFDNVHVMVSQ